MKNEVKYGWLCVALSWLALLVIPGTVSAGLETGIQVNASGQLRYYDLYVPDGLGSQPRALVIDMHGYSVNASRQRRESGFLELADAEKFIVAWPEGFGGAWNSGFGYGGIDDVGTVRAVVAHIASNQNIDPKRIYATGWSNGGEMAYRLACDASDLFAAVSSVAGDILVGSEVRCIPDRPVPVLSFRGSDDGIVPYGGGVIPDWGEIYSARETHEVLKDINGCQGADRSESLGSASCSSNSQCDGGVVVTSCTVQGGGAPSNHDLYEAPGVNIARDTWNFFQAFTLPELQDEFQINAGLNDAWYNPETDGQGFFIVAFEDIQSVFLAWFTYDTQLPSGEPAKLGNAGHRWLTAFGPYSSGSASLEVLSTSNGVFDTATQVEREVAGTIDLTFDDCLSGQIEYNLGAIGRQGQIPIQRIVADLVPACDGSAEPGDGPGSGGFQVNRGLNDAWYQPATDGQGFFIITWPEIEQVFLSWFTYETELPLENTAQLGDSGQRWLTALGPYSGNTAVLDITVTSGGLFDDPRGVDNVPGGTITLEFEDCNAGVVSYDIDSIDRRGEIPIQRIAPDNLPTCEVLAGETSAQ